MAHDRRSTDKSKHNDEIAELIKLEDDPKNRAFLIILQNINLSLLANTQTVNDIDVQLKEHLVEFKNRTSREDALLNKGKGAWQVVSWLLGTMQIATVWVMIHTYNDIKELHAADASIDTRLTVIETKR
jgi:hypothetical protein